MNINKDQEVTLIKSKGAINLKLRRHEEMVRNYMVINKKGGDMITILICLSMIAFLVYFYCLRLLFLTIRTTQTSKTFILNCFMGVNVSTVLLLVLKGLPLAIMGMRPPDVVLIILLLYCIMQFYGSIEITGNLFLDSLCFSLTITCIAAVIPAGIWKIYEEGITKHLFLSWLTISMITAIVAKTFCLTIEEGL